MVSPVACYVAKKGLPNETCPFRLIPLCANRDPKGDRFFSVGALIPAVETRIARNYLTWNLKRPLQPIRKVEKGVAPLKAEFP